MNKTIVQITEEDFSGLEELSYDQDCLSREFLTDLLLNVYMRQVSIEKAVTMILDDVEYLRHTLSQGK
jgi:hypothetical protein